MLYDVKLLCKNRKKIDYAKTVVMAEYIDDMLNSFIF